jgi:hypothetical protein
MDNVQQQKSQSSGPKAENESPSVPQPETTNDPEVEKLRTENTALQTTLQMRDARDELTRSLADAGARSPMLLFASAKDDLRFSDDGKLQNAAAIIGHLKHTFPEQFGIQKPDASIDGGAGTLTSTQTLSADALSKMTPAQIQNLNWDDVRRVISG